MYLKEGGGESKEKALHYYYCKYWLLNTSGFQHFWV
jgi:hypothetical protein